MAESDVRAGLEKREGLSAGPGSNAKPARPRASSPKRRSRRHGCGGWRGARRCRFLLPGEIHDTLDVTGDWALVLRLEWQKRDRVVRYQYNPEEGTVNVMET